MTGVEFRPFLEIEGSSVPIANIEVVRELAEPFLPTDYDRSPQSIKETIGKLSGTGKFFIAAGLLLAGAADSEVKALLEDEKNFKSWSTQDGDDVPIHLSHPSLEIESTLRRLGCHTLLHSHGREIDERSLPLLAIQLGLGGIAVATHAQKFVDIRSIGVPAPEIKITDGDTEGAPAETSYTYAQLLDTTTGLRLGRLMNVAPRAGIRTTFHSSRQLDGEDEIFARGVNVWAENYATDHFVSVAADGQTTDMETNGRVAGQLILVRADCKFTQGELVAARGRIGPNYSVNGLEIMANAFRIANLQAA